MELSTRAFSTPWDCWSGGPSFGASNLVCKNVTANISIRKNVHIGQELDARHYGTSLPHMTELRCLGMRFDESLAWRRHISVPS